MKKLLFMVPCFLLAACGPDGPGNPPYVKSEFEIDGCQVKYVYHPSMPNFYIARCGNTTTTTWQKQQGKSTVTEASINVDNADDLRNRLATVEARDKALAKLTADERKALGIK